MAVKRRGDDHDQKTRKRVKRHDTAFKSHQQRRAEGEVHSFVRRKRKRWGKDGEGKELMRLNGKSFSKKSKNMAGRPVVFFD